MCKSDRIIQGPYKNRIVVPPPPPISQGGLACMLVELWVLCESSLAA